MTVLYLNLCYHLNERKCKICTIDDIGDEYHYLFTCDYFTSDRTVFLC